MVLKSVTSSFVAPLSYQRLQTDGGGQVNETAASVLPPSCPGRCFYLKSVLSPSPGVTTYIFIPRGKLNRVQTEVAEDKWGGLELSGRMFWEEVDCKRAGIPQIYRCRQSPGVCNPSCRAFVSPFLQEEEGRQNEGIVRCNGESLDKLYGFFINVLFQA